MEKTIKVTKAMVLKAIEGYFTAEGYDPEEVIAVSDGVEVTVSDIVAYTAKTLTQIEAKAEKSKEYAAKKRAASDDLKAEVKAALTDELQTREDVLAALDAGEEITVAKVGARLTALVKDGVAVKEEFKTVTGKKMGYKLA